jgi:hypothetical protein
MVIRDALSSLAVVDLAEGNLVLARAHVTEGLGLAQRMGFAEQLITGLEDLAWLAFAEGQPGRAVRLFGAATAQREAIGYSPARSGLLERVQAARHAVGDAEAERAWAAGLALPAEQAIDEAIKPSPPKP